MNFEELRKWLDCNEYAYEAAMSCVQLGFGNTPWAMYQWAIEKSVSLTQPTSRRISAKKLADTIVSIALSKLNWVNFPGD